MAFPTRDEQRRAFWRQLGASAQQADELVPHCHPLPAPQEASTPLKDELHVDFYRGLPSHGEGLLDGLKTAFPQLNFSPAQGVSQTTQWIAAVRRGEAVAHPQPKSPFLSPDTLQLLLLPTLAGTLPALVTPCREDFVTLVQLLAHRGEPAEVPPSMGALLLSGVVNWQRVRQFVALQHAQPAAGQAANHRAWAQLQEQKQLYQDRLVLACHGPYSGVAQVEGLTQTEWHERSLTLRLAHEATHYFTLRLFGRLSHTVAEELVADWVGLTTALGRYPVGLAQSFLGVEKAPAFRPGGRLANYRGNPPLSDQAFALLVQASAMATQNLATFPPGHVFLAAKVQALLTLSLEELASSAPALEGAEG
ncbi:MAG: hypothetical protein N2447_03495 [Thermoanaerobaculum sp.]|nr:hypothetical protein [Thermoanaerobaculum sp.]